MLFMMLKTNNIDGLVVLIDILGVEKIAGVDGSGRRIVCSVRICQK